MPSFARWRFRSTAWWRSERRQTRAVRSVSRFAAAHGGASALLEPLGRPGTRIVLVGVDGRWGDLLVTDIETAGRVCEQAGVDAVAGWPRDVRDRMRDTESEWRRMGGRRRSPPAR